MVISTSKNFRKFIWQRNKTDTIYITIMVVLSWKEIRKIVVINKWQKVQDQTKNAVKNQRLASWNLLVFLPLSQCKEGGGSTNAIWGIYCMQQGLHLWRLKGEGGRVGLEDWRPHTSAMTQRIEIWRLPPPQISLSFFLFEKYNTLCFNLNKNWAFFFFLRRLSCNFL